jgi:hypothetical protein
VTKWVVVSVPAFLWRDKAGWTGVFLAASYKALLGIVGNVCGNNGIDMADLSIGTHYLHSCLPCIYQQLQHLPHAIMEELVDCSLPPLLIQPAFLQLGHRKVSKEDIGTSRGFPADRFRDVTDGDVDGVCLLVPTESRELGFVGCKNDGGDGSSRWEQFLKTCKNLPWVDSMAYVPVDSTTSQPSKLHYIHDFAGCENGRHVGGCKLGVL